MSFELTALHHQLILIFFKTLLKKEYLFVVLNLKSVESLVLVVSLYLNYSYQFNIKGRFSKGKWHQK